jgi:molybdopterin molybdotransferase
MLSIALREMGMTDIQLYFAKDDPDETVSALEKALRACDVVLLTGGVSVGEYDFVVPAAERCGVYQLFHRIKQRPGKPLYAGRKDNQPVFGLPGNPSSVLTCFYEYVWPVLRKLTGHDHQLKTLTVPLSAPHKKPHQLKHFLKGYYTDGRVTILPGQESYRMRSFATANCLVVLDEPPHEYQENDLVNIHLLPVYG